MRMLYVGKKIIPVSSIVYLDGGASAYTGDARMGCSVIHLSNGHQVFLNAEETTKLVTILDRMHLAALKEDDK